MKMIDILGVKLVKANKYEVLNDIDVFLSAEKSRYVVTPNPEIILEAQIDEELFYILNHASLSVPDGIGLKFAALTMGKKMYRFPGADLSKEILKRAEDRNLKVGIANWEKGLSKKPDLETALKEKYPSLNFLIIDMARQGWANDELNSEVTDRLDAFKNFQPQILFSTFGSPYQEKFIFHALKSLPSARLGIGIGGALDFLTGKIKRAPKFMRRFGIEWLWRLLKQPSRIKRIYNAIINFPLKFLKWKFVNRFFYRRNVAVLLYKKEESGYKIFLVERSDGYGHWQLPQGGTDGQNLKEAGERELREEAGTNKFKIISSYENLWKYDFRPEIEKNKGYGYRGQMQGLVIAEFFGNDKDINIKYWDHSAWKWVKAEELVDAVHPVRKKAANIFLEKFILLTHNS